MTKTRRARRRREHDFYPSPKWAASTLYNRLPCIRNIAEPCVGVGDLIHGRDDVDWTNDIDESRPATYHLNAAAPAAWNVFPKVPWVVTNPPFNVAHIILSCALDSALVGVAFLLRISFLEPVEARAQLLSRRPPTRQIVLPRMSFTGDGKTDSVTCAWFVWALKPGLVEPGIEVCSPIERDVHRRVQNVLPW